MIRTAALALALAASLLAAPCRAQQPAPKGPQTTPDGKTVFPGPKGKTVAFPLDLYDEQADGPTQIREASLRAAGDNKRVLIMWGENYCGFCSELNDLLDWEVPRLRSLVASEYEFIKIDLGKGFAKVNHIDLAKTYGTDIRTGGAPSLTVIDPATGRGAGSLEGKAALAKPMTMQRVYDDQKLFEFLMQSRPTPKVAMTALNEQLLFASRAGKKLLVWFGEPESPASSELHRWFTDPGVIEALAPGYLILKIDPQRMTTGRMVMDRITGRPGAPCPFIAILNNQGQPIDAASLIDGYPSTSEQRTALRSALTTHAPDLDAAKLDAAFAKLPEKPAEPTRAPAPVAPAPSPAP
jgi:hypothetical protein